MQGMSKFSRGLTLRVRMSCFYENFAISMIIKRFGIVTNVGF